jgi:hypothetical protein
VQYFDASSISAPVTNGMTIKLILMRMLASGGIAHVVDVKGAFLHGKFEDGEKIYIKIPLGFEEFYYDDIVLLLKKCLYGLKQVAMAFYRKLLAAASKIGLKRSSADPCLYYKWEEKRLVIMISWIDDNMIVGPSDLVLKLKSNLMEHFKCKDCGVLTEYIRNKIECIGEDAIQLVQTVLSQSYEDKFELGNRCYNMPAQTGMVLLHPVELDWFRLSYHRVMRTSLSLGTDAITCQHSLEWCCCVQSKAKKFLNLKIRHVKIWSGKAYVSDAIFEARHCTGSTRLGVAHVMRELKDV